MARRVRFDGSGVSGSPLRISVAGVDALTAQFNNVIFDGNQSPFRLLVTGFTTVNGITWNQRQFGKNINEGPAIPLPLSSPPGTTPIFTTMWRLNDGQGKVYTPSFQPSSNPVIGGAGGGICSGNFCPACFTTGAPGAPDSLPNVTFINYCIFKNAN
jgi:hypothetical protein